MAITLHQGDLPANLKLGNEVAVDTETLGLNPVRDRLCLVQISSGDGNAHLVQLAAGKYNAPNLKKLLGDKKVLKIFHFARFDVAVIKAYLGVDCAPIYCTRTASKLTRTYTDRHGLREICRELLGVEISKQQQSSDWGAKKLSEDQMQYAANDVLHLHKLKDKMDKVLKREDRTQLAEDCFQSIIVRAMLDIGGWPNDLYDH